MGGDAQEKQDANKKEQAGRDQNQRLLQRVALPGDEKREPLPALEHIAPIGDDRHQDNVQKGALPPG